MRDKQKNWTTNGIEPTTTGIAGESVEVFDH
jgi:hypothetical protein